MHISEPLATPVVTAEPAPRGVRLTFNGDAPRPGLGWRIFRRAGAQKAAVELAQSQAAEYIDATAEFGKPYEYSAQAFLASGAESEISKPVMITPEDTFPPATPSGLTAVATARSIEVSWDPATEPDLKGYYLYRWLDGQRPLRIGDLLDTPAYSDHDIKSGTQYMYAVSAVDQRGNESARSAPVQAIAQ
jgi:fibronectin type 3 domain-containing protein